MRIDLDQISFDCAYYLGLFLLFDDSKRNFEANL